MTAYYVLLSRLVGSTGQEITAIEMIATHSYKEGGISWPGVKLRTLQYLRWQSGQGAVDKSLHCSFFEGKKDEKGYIHLPLVHLSDFGGLWSITAAPTCPLIGPRVCRAGEFGLRVWRSDKAGGWGCRLCSGTFAFERNALE